MKNRLVIAAKSQTSSIKVLFTGLFLAVPIMYGFQFYGDHVRRSIPASSWMEVTSITISDAEQFEDPQITHVERSIKFEGRVTGHWEAAVYSPETGQLLCAGSGSSPNYNKNAQIKFPIGVLDWWLFKKNPEVDCEIWPFPVGKTCLYTKWTFTPDRYPFQSFTRSPRKFGNKIIEAPDEGVEFCWMTKPILFRR